MLVDRVRDLDDIAVCFLDRSAQAALAAVKTGNASRSPGRELWRLVASKSLATEVTESVLATSRHCAWRRPRG